MRSLTKRTTKRKYNLILVQKLKILIHAFIQNVQIFLLAHLKERSDFNCNN